MSAKYSQPLDFDMSELEDIHRILLLTAHRNHNQHRLAKWWKNFQMLRRNLSKLLVDLKDHTKTRTKTSRVAFEDRITLILEYLIPKCYRSFGTVISDNQYSALGLMLMGTLARLNKIILPLQRKPVTLVSAPVEKKNVIPDDIGELVSREDQEDIEPQLKPKPSKQPGPEPEKSGIKSKKKSRPTSMLSSSENTTPKPPKKKRKKGNAIDDLFSSIL